MNFSTPFTCTEIIAHMKTLKYLALASKNQCWSRRRHQKTSSFFERIEGNCASDRPARLVPGGDSAARDTIFIFVRLLFVLF